VTSGYFETLRIPIVRGRAFSHADREGAEPVVIVNQAMAKRFWPDRDPIGRRIRMERNGPWVSIVGVAGDIRHRALDRTPDVEMFLPFTQNPNRVMTVALRTSGDPGALASAVRAEVQALDRNLPVSLVGPLEDLVRDSVAAPRFYTALLSVFAAMALVLAAVGIYGVTAYAVVQRVPEIGLRIALGAQRGDVVRLILGQGLLLVGSGLAVGTAASLLLTRTMSTLLFEVSATDPASYAVTAALLIVTALMASYVPARRALGVDPTIALRAE
jgi:putative ABC transport system permease protein